MKLHQRKNIVNVNSFDKFYDDLLDQKENLKFSDLELIFKLKVF